MLPKQSRGKAVIWALSLVALGPYIANTLDIRAARASALHTLEHPVETLVRNAVADFDRLLKWQSTTYTAAVEEYQRRYRAEPPPGFEAWYNFAVANQSPLVDEFDTIYHSVSPFWKLSGKEVVQIMNEAYKTSDIDLWLCSFTGATAETQCRHPVRSSDRHTADMFNKLLGDMPGILPNISFLVNHLDEPRVLSPPQSASAPNKTQITLTNLSERPTWNAVTQFCPPSPNPSTESPLLSLPLVTNLTTARSLCANPAYAHSHGLFQAPASFSLITGPVPVLTSGSPSTMSDILFPSPAYLIEPEFRYNPDHDPPWHLKSPHLYWAGSTTGAVASTKTDWQSFHRQRFLTLAQNLQSTPHLYLTESPTIPSNNPTIAPSRFLNARHYAVHPTRIFQCPRPAACRAQRFHFRLKRWQPRDAALQSKLVFDLDGNGISGRFYKLLASRSAVLKMTVLREWHDDRLVPWVHYVPVGVGMGEVAEVVRWFLETARGEEVARGVGERGAEWVGQAVREVDVKVYLWRLVLELARVGDPGRGVLGG